MTLVQSLSLSVLQCLHLKTGIKVSPVISIRVNICKELRTFKVCHILTPKNVNKNHFSFPLQEGLCSRL